MEKVLVSACLLGQRVRYDGGAHGPFDLLKHWHSQGRLVTVCPEVAGGLPTPRPAAEIIGGQGAEVLQGQALVVDVHGRNVSAAFIDGAKAALRLVQTHNIRLAVLKARSPSCANLQTYDGSFSGAKVDGQGVTAALLTQAGVLVFNETQLEQAAQALAVLEAE